MYFLSKKPSHIDDLTDILTNIGCCIFPDKVIHCTCSYNKILSDLYYHVRIFILNNTLIGLEINWKANAYNVLTYLVKEYGQPFKTKTNEGFNIRDGDDKKYYFNGWVQSDKYISIKYKTNREKYYDSPITMIFDRILVENYQKEYAWGEGVKNGN